MSPKKKEGEMAEEFDTESTLESLEEVDSVDDVDMDVPLAKIKKLKEDLAACKRERQEFLDGWQRLKADVANSKRLDSEKIKKSISIAQEGIVSDLIPIIDNFDMARMGEAWESVDKNWRVGVEAIIAQIEQLMGSYGAERIGKKGDKFNPNLHEAVKEVEDGKEGEIVAILRSGWKIGDAVLRPAQVTVSK